MQKKKLIIKISNNKMNKHKPQKQNQYLKHIKIFNRFVAINSWNRS